VPGVNVGYHNLSHHGQDEENIAQLKRVERAFFDELKTLLTNLKNTKEGEASLLDRTTIVVTSNLGSGNGHGSKDLHMSVASDKVASTCRASRRFSNAREGPLEDAPRPLRERSARPHLPRPRRCRNGENALVVTRLLK
jgi:hypothetical protein